MEDEDLTFSRRQYLEKVRSADAKTCLPTGRLSLIGKEGSKVKMHAYIEEESKAVKTPTSRKSQIFNLLAQKIRSLF